MAILAEEDELRRAATIKKLCQSVEESRSNLKSRAEAEGEFV